MEFYNYGNFFQYFPSNLKFTVKTDIKKKLSLQTNWIFLQIENIFGINSLIKSKTIIM